MASRRFDQGPSSGHAPPTADPRAAGMVIAMDQDHARGIGQLLRDRLGSATVATSDDPSASRKIADFAVGYNPWIVAVRMVSEGVDIPRLRVGVYATNTVTDLFFRQAVGRLVRMSGALREQLAYMFIPDDLRLRRFAFSIAEQRRHSLRKSEKKDELDGQTAYEESQEAETANDEGGEQLSLFAPISAIPLDETGQLLDASRVYEESGDTLSVNDTDGIPGLVHDEDEVPDAAFHLLEPELIADIPTPPPAPEPEPMLSPRNRRRQLRESNNARVRTLVHLTGKGHADVNLELNRRVGIRRVTEATVTQLERRLNAADRWLQKLM